MPKRTSPSTPQAREAREAAAPSGAAGRRKSSKRQGSAAASSGRHDPKSRKAAVQIDAGDRRFRDLVEGSIQGILIHRDFVPLFVNSACAQILGYAGPQEVLALGSLDPMLPADECQRVRQLAEGRINGKEVPAQYELRVRRKDDSLVWIELRPSVIEWDGEPAIQVAMVDIDERKRVEMELREAHANLERLVAERTQALADEITNRRRTEESLRESEQKYRSLVDNMEDGVFLIRDGRIVFANRGAGTLLGCEPDAMIGRLHTDFVAPKSRKKVAALHRRRIAGEAADERYETELLHSDGRVIPVMLNAARIETPQGETAVLGTVRDITERKQAEIALRESEERFKALFDNSPLSLNLKDAEGRYLLVNYEWEHQHAAKADTVRGRTSEEVFGAEMGHRLSGIERDVIATGKAQTFEATVQLADERLQTRLITKFPVRDGRGKISRVGTAGIDITERKAMEKALRESEEMFRTLLDNSPIFIHVKDVEGRYLLVNPVFEQTHGMKPCDVIGRTAGEIFPRETAAAIDAADRETLTTGKTTVFEANFQFPDGTQRTHLGTKFAIRDSSGVITRLGTFVIDITERKRMEKALRDSEEQLRAIVDYASAAINLKDTEGRFLLVNRGFERLHAVRQEDVLGKTISMLFGDERAAVIRAEESEVLENGETRSFETDFVSENGEHQTYLVTKFPVRDGDGAITRIGTFAMDISERKRMENALRQSEERFRALIDNAQAIIDLKDREGRYLLVNKEYERRFGVPAERTIGARGRDFMPPADAADAERREQQVLDSGKPVAAEVVVDHRQDGKSTFYHVVKFPIFGDGGQVEQIGTFSTDITERKRAEEALKASEEWFRDFAQSTSDWLWESDAEGRIVYMSERLHDIFGEAASALLGRRRRDFAAPGQESSLRELDRIMDSRQPIRNFRYEALSTDGRRFWVRITGQPRFSKNGAFLGYRGTGTDITEEVQAVRREAQVTERLLAAIETVAVALALFDDQDRLVVANQDFRTQFLTADQWTDGITFEAMLRLEADAGGYPESYGNKEEWIQDRLKRHRNPSGIFEMTKSNGLVIQIHENLTSDGYTLVVAYDITASKTAEQALILARDELEARVRERTQALEQEIVERQYAEQALQEANTELERRVEERTSHLRDEIAERKKMEAQFLQAQKMEAVGQLAGGIAHDFNNLLTVIQGNLSWLSEVVKVDDKVTRLMGMALEAARRAGQLTHRMLAFSRRQDLRPEPVDLRQTLEGMEPLIARALSEAVKLEIDIGDDYGPLLIDAHQLESAILNIAINARDAMPNGGKFSLHVERCVIDAAEAAQRENAQSGDYVLLSMADTGAGMAPEVLERVFDPFFTTKEVGKGSGLGLSMVFGFVNQSGGFIEIDSTPGKGTRVDIFLPQAPKAVAAAAPASSDTASEAFPDVTVLVVEDDPLVRGVTVEYLKMAGINTLEAGDGRAAIAILENEQAIGIVLSDVIMPGGLSGLDLANLIRERWPQTEILLMSGYSYDEFARHGIDPDAIGLLRKPFTKDELMLKIRGAISSEDPR